MQDDQLAPAAGSMRSPERHAAVGCGPGTWSCLPARYGLTGHFRDTLCYRARRAQLRIRVAEPPGHHSFAITHAHVSRVRLTAGALASAPFADKRNAAGLNSRANSRIEFVQRLGSGGRHPLRPLTQRRSSGLPGRGQLPCRVVCVTAHDPMLSPGLSCG